VVTHRAEVVERRKTGSGEEDLTASRHHHFSAGRCHPFAAAAAVAA
jgi:hypothetical protein